MNKSERKGTAKISIDEYDILKFKEKKAIGLEARVKYLEKAVEDIIKYGLLEVKGPLKEVAITYMEKLEEPIVCQYSHMDQCLRIYLKENI